jgi:hypothetical protein
MVWDWDGVSDDAVREILRQGELQMADILAVSIAADQRAMTLCATFSAVAAALAAAGIALFSTDKYDMGVAISVGIMAVGFLAASFICGFGGSPRPFYPSGYEPKVLIGAGSDALWAMRYSAEDIQIRIERNRMSLRRVASLTNWGFRATMISVGLAIMAYVIVKALSRWTY